MPSSLFKILSCFILCVFLSPNSISQTQKKPKNIILLIGDGMGLSEISSSLYFNEKPSNFLRFNTGVFGVFFAL